MDIDQAITALYRRVDVFLERGDGESVLSEAAMAEAAQLEDAAGDDPAVMSVVGWLLWCRYFAGDSSLENLEALLDRFLVVQRTHPEALPEGLRVTLGALDGLPGGTADLDMGFLYSLAGVFKRRFDRTNDRTDIDRAVAAMAAVASALGHDEPMHPVALILLGSYLTNRFSDAGGQAEDLRAAEQVLAEGRAIVEPGHELRTVLLEDWVLLRATQFDNNAGVQQASALIDALDETLAELDRADPVWARTAELATGLIGQLVDALPARDFDRSVTLWRLGVVAFSPEDVGHGSALFQLGSALALRGAEGAVVRDLTEAIDVLRLAVAATAGPLHALSTTALGNAHLSRYECAGDQADVTSAIVALRGAATDLPDDHMIAELCRTNLGSGLILAYETGAADGTQLDEAIDILRSVVGAADQDVRARAQSVLGNALKDRFLLTTDDHDLDEAVQWSRSAAETVAPDSYNPTMHLNNLGSALLYRAERRGAAADLDEAIAIFQRLCETVSEDHPEYLIYQANLAQGLLQRFSRRGDRSDADAALRIARGLAAAHLPAGMVSAQLTSVGNALLTAYEISGSVRDLDTAVSLIRRLADAIPVGHIRRGDALSLLGTALIIRHEQVGAAADASEAVECFRQALTVHGASGKQHLYLASLCNALEQLYRMTGDAALLDEAVRVGHSAVDLAADTAASVSYRTNLAKAYTTRYEALRHESDLDRAIGLERLAVAEAAAGNPRRPRYLSNLGGMLLKRYGITGNQSDLDEAIALLRESADSTSAGEARRALHFYNLGMAVLSKHSSTQDRADLGAAIRAWREAAGTVTSPIHHRILAARAWGNAAAEHGDTDSALAGYEQAVTLLPLLIWRGLRRTDQERQLLELIGIASEAAAAALAADRPTRAVELLEQGRSVLWSQLLDTRTNLSALRNARAELADRLDSIRAGLERLDGQSDHDPLPGSGDRRMALARQWDDLIAGIRRLDGFADFLQPSPFADLCTAAARGPVVIINLSRSRCDALIIAEEHVRVVPLPDLTAQSAAEKAGEFLTAAHKSPAGVVDAVARVTVLNEVLEWLWRTVTAPVLAELGAVRRVWWCPTGALALLPLHAAGIPGTEDTVLDRVISSYTPTLRALMLARRNAPEPTGRPKVLIVAMPHTEGTQDLNVQPEIETITRLLPHLCTIRETSKATRDQIVTDLPRHRVAHFACHGHFDPHQPSASGLVLYDQLLSVLDVSRLRLTGSELAYLSACDTAAGGDLPDESIHLGAALNLAGYSHVVATLWPIYDATAAQASQEFYESLTATGAFLTDHAADALHAAVTELRDAGNAMLPTIWAPYAHVGP